METLAASVLAKVAVIAAVGKSVELAQTSAEPAGTAAKGNETAMGSAADVNWSNIGGA